MLSTGTRSSGCCRRRFPLPPHSLLGNGWIPGYAFFPFLFFFLKKNNYPAVKLACPHGLAAGTWLELSKRAHSFFEDDFLCIGAAGWNLDTALIGLADILQHV